MLRQSLQQKLLQKLSPQQIQLMKLLQLPTMELEVRIKEELEANPALEEGQEKDEWDVGLHTGRFGTTSLRKDEDDWAVLSPGYAVSAAPSPPQARGRGAQRPPSSTSTSRLMQCGL